MYIKRPDKAVKPKEEEIECVIIVVDPDQPQENYSFVEPKATANANYTVNKLDTTTPLPEVVINERTLVFRMDSRTLWTRYALGMINYSVSSFGSLASTPSVEKNLSKSAAAIGDFFVPYYGIRAGAKIGSLLVVIANNGTKVVESIKTNKDITPYQVIWNKQIEELASYFNELNPGQYPVDLINEIFVSLVSFWIEDFKARFEGDFVADTIALDNILKVAVSGIPNHVNKGYSSIADILSRGIIAQFPLSFVE